MCIFATTFCEGMFTRLPLIDFLCYYIFNIIQLYDNFFGKAGNP